MFNTSSTSVLTPLPIASRVRDGYAPEFALDFRQMAGFIDGEHPP